MRPVVALLTDFGTRDPYVAAMKAVIAGRCEAAILDLSHEVAPFDVFEAAYFLRSISGHLMGRRFIVVAVVDPGVGTERRILAASRGESVFLAPDNGLLSLIELEKVRSVEDSSLFLPAGSTTFHGRDRFAPVAAAIANGKAIDDLGPKVSPDAMVKLDYTPPRTDGGVISGTVVAIDRFGNVITDISADGVKPPVQLVLGFRSIDKVARSYREAEQTGDPFLIVGSRGTFEISVAKGSAADLLHIARFDSVELRTGE